MSDIIVKKQATPTLLPDAGEVSIYVSSTSGVIESIDEAGTVTTYATPSSSLTTENVQDIVGAMTVNSTTVVATYNDPANTITYDVDATGINHTQLQNIGTNTHAQIDTHIANTSNPHSVTKSQVGLGNVVDLDQTNPANITQDTTHRFTTDAEKTTWNGKQNALGYSPLNPANNLSDILSISSARTNLGLGTASTQNSTAFDAAGTASTQMSTHISNSDPHTQYVKADGTRAITGDLSLSGTSKIINAAQASSAGQFVEYAQWQASLSGIKWLLPIICSALVNDSLSSPPASPGEESYLVGPSATGAWTGMEGYLVEYRVATGTWATHTNAPVHVGDRIGIRMEAMGTLGGNLVGHQNQIATITNATPGSYAYTFYTPATNDSLYVNDPQCIHFGDTYNFDGTTWVEIPGAVTLNPGAALSASGNTWNVNVDNTTIEINGSDVLKVKDNIYDSFGSASTVQGNLTTHTSDILNPHSVTKSQVGLGNVPNVDTTNPANITQDTTHRFASDTEKTTWNSKEASIAAGTIAQYWRGDKTWQTLNSTSVGLGNVNNTADTAKTIAGDVSGTLGASTVDKIKGVAIAATAPSTGQVLTYNGSTWSPATPSGGGGGSSTPTYTITTTSAVVLSLVSSSNSYQLLIGTTPGMSISLPDATTGTIGVTYFRLVNSSSTIIPIKDFSGAFISTLYPNQQKEILLIDNTLSTGVWIVNIESSTLAKQSVLFDDFISSGITSGTIGELPWTLVAGGGHTVSYFAGTSTDNGILTLGTGTAILAGYAIHLGNTATLVGGGPMVQEWRVRFPTLATTTQDYNCYIGLNNTINTTGETASGIYFTYNRATSTNWIIKTANASVRTATTTSIAVAANTWHKLQLVVNAAGTQVDYYIDNTFVGSITTNIPTAVTVASQYNIQKSVGTTDIAAHIDYFYGYKHMNTTR
jgi:hypothetical protein